VADPRRAAAGADPFQQRGAAGRQVGRALQRGLVQAGADQGGPGSGDVHVLAVVTRARERQRGVAPAETALEQRHRLQRLQR
jgi:hypothetical protein